MSMNDNNRIAYLEEQIESLNKEKRAILDALELAANLGNYRISLNKIENPLLILRETSTRVNQLMDFKATCFYLVNEDDSNFYQEYTDPDDYSKYIEKEIGILIEDKTFFWVLNRNKPVVVSSSDKKDQLVLHSMNTSSRTRGIFIG